MPAYLDYNATTPVEGRVANLILKYMTEEFGNAGSRTHEMGQRAKKAVNEARDQIAGLVGARQEEVVFTSGATESDNLAILGLQAYAEKVGKKHIVTTSIEHKAVLEPIDALVSRGFSVSYVPVDSTGVVNTKDVLNAIRTDTVLVSIMHANNETGAIQPIGDIASQMDPDGPYFHVDAAQSFGKLFGDLEHQRIDLLSISGHKIFGPKGVGALITRYRGGLTAPPLSPLMFGGGQERNLRPGTLPVALLAGFGLASLVSKTEFRERKTIVQSLRKDFIEKIKSLGAEFNSDLSKSMDHVVNFSIPGLDSESLIVAIKSKACISNGSACTSNLYKPSHVLVSQGFAPDRIAGAIRVSWSHLTSAKDLEAVVDTIAAMDI
jgi:cysteine desulfurase